MNLSFAESEPDRTKILDKNSMDRMRQGLAHGPSTGDESKIFGGSEQRSGSPFLRSSACGSLPGAVIDRSFVGGSRSDQARVAQHPLIRVVKPLLGIRGRWSV